MVWPEATKIKARIRRNVRKISPEEARRIAETFRGKLGGTERRRFCRYVSGGYWSQSLDALMSLELVHRIRNTNPNTGGKIV